MAMKTPMRIKKQI